MALGLGLALGLEVGSRFLTTTTHQLLADQRGVLLLTNLLGVLLLTNLLAYQRGILDVELA